MKGTKPLTRIFYIFAIVIGEMLASAYMIQEATIHAESTDQTVVRTDQLALLTKRLDELELSRVKDVEELNLRIQELSEFRRNDARALTRLNDEVEEQKRLRAKDLRLINVLTARIGELERQCEHVEHAENFNSKKTQNPPRNETPYYNRSDETLHVPAAATLDNTTANEDHLLTNSDDTSSSITNSGQGRIRSRQPGRITRVSSSDETVAFHAILSHTISDLATHQTVIFDNLVTNSGGVHYSSNTGIFTATQSGIHVFSWAIGVTSNEYVYIVLVKNNAVIGSSSSGNGHYFSSTSATAAVHLDVGDEVWVRADYHRDGCIIHGTRSMFTGFLLK